MSELATKVGSQESVPPQELEETVSMDKELPTLLFVGGSGAKVFNDFVSCESSLSTERYNIINLTGDEGLDV